MSTHQVHVLTAAIWNEKEDRKEKKSRGISWIFQTNFSVIIFKCLFEKSVMLWRTAAKAIYVLLHGVFRLPDPGFQNYLKYEILNKLLVFCIYEFLADLSPLLRNGQC